MTDAEIVLAKLGVLREHVSRARRRRPERLEALRADVDVQDALSMSLMVAVQEAVDVAFHIAADEKWGVPATYAESFDLLATRGVLSAELGRRLASAAALRNRIAHGCASVDLDRLWRELPGGLDALEEFATAIAAFLPR